MNRALAALFGAGLLLASCGQQSPPEASSSSSPAATYGDGVDHSWTASQAEAQRVYGSLSSGLKAQDFNVGVFITATSGWGPIEFNTSNGETAAGDGHPITLNGKVYPTGLGVHANSEIHVHAIGLETPACTRFQADVGIDDEVGDRGSVVFQVYANGEKLFDSGVMTGASPTQHIDVPIGNKNDLRFVVTDGGDNIDYDHADWAGAALTCASPPPPTLSLASTDLSVYHLHHTDVQATFGGTYDGPVDLRLERTTYTYDPTQYIVLQTKQVTLTGNPTTIPLTFTAPRLPFAIPEGNGSPFDKLKNTYRVVASVNGTDVASVPVTIEEKLLSISARFDPDSLSGSSFGSTGTTASTTLIVTFDPPLEGDYQAQEKSGGVGGVGYTDCAHLTFGAQTYAPSEIRVPVTVEFNSMSLAGQFGSCKAGGYLYLGDYAFGRYSYYSSLVLLNAMYMPYQYPN